METKKPLTINLLLILVLVFSFTLGSNLQAANPINESFTGVTFTPAGWSKIHVFGLFNGGDWERSTTGFRTAPACAFSGGTLLGDNFLVTKKITPNPGDSLVFWVSPSNYLITALGRLDVLVSTTDSLSGSFFDFIIPLNLNLGILTQNVYVRRAVSLNAYAGQPIFLAFRHIEVLGLFGGVRIDDASAGGQDLDLTCLLEGHLGGGPFNTPRRDRDTVVVDIRSSTSPFGVVQSRTVFLDTLGKKVVNYTAASDGVPYYVVVDHRNSIRTWSKSGGETFVNASLSFDFTTALTQAFGNNMKIKFGYASYFTGDPVKDGIVDAQDLVYIFNDVFNIVTGDYVLSDLNWDTITDAEDLILAYNNSINFVQEMAP